jgi:hypothetical protein
MISGVLTHEGQRRCSTICSEVLERLLIKVGMFRLRSWKAVMKSLDYHICIVVRTHFKYTELQL